MSSAILQLDASFLAHLPHAMQHLITQLPTSTAAKPLWPLWFLARPLWPLNIHETSTAVPPA